MKQFLLPLLALFPLMPIQQEIGSYEGELDPTTAYRYTAEDPGPGGYIEAYMNQEYIVFQDRMERSVFEYYKGQIIEVKYQTDNSTYRSYRVELTTFNLIYIANIPQNDTDITFRNVFETNSLNYQEFAIDYPYYNFLTNKETYVYDIDIVTESTCIDRMIDFCDTGNSVAYRYTLFDEYFRELIEDDFNPAYRDGISGRTAVAHNNLTLTNPIENRTIGESRERYYYGCMLTQYLYGTVNYNDYPYYNAMPNDFAYYLNPYFDIDASIRTVNYGTEVVDIPGLMFTILGMPFAWISTAFNLTLFPGTIYQVNVANIFFMIISALVLMWIIKKLVR